MKLIVLNLPRNLDEHGLEKLFKVYGAVTACTLVHDDKRGASKGFGFVEMEREEDAIQAIQNLHGTKLKQSRIRVKPAT